MAKEIETRPKLISSYFKLGKNANFVIPEYQRGYSWDITKCDKLWQDIEAFIESNATDPYFFGTIIVDCSETDKLNLIDGQQRTTTFLLLLKALLLNLNDTISRIPNNDDDSTALKYGLEDKRNKIMAILYKADPEEIPSMLKDSNKIKDKLIVENKSINELYLNEVSIIIESTDFEKIEQNVHKIPRKQKDNKYTNHFRNFKFFYSKLKNKSAPEINRFSKIFLEECQIIEIRSWHTEQAITMFNSLNSTGMPLSDADIISAQLYSNSDSDKDTFNELWRSITAQADKLKILRIANIDSVLQQFMYFNRAFNKEYAKINSVDVTTPGLRRYYTEIKKDLLDTPLVLSDNFMKITKIWDITKDYPITKLVLKYNENIKLYFMSYLFRFHPDNISEDKVLEISNCLLRLFSLLELVEAGYSSKNFKTFLFAENLKLTDPNVSIEEIKVDFDNHIKSNWKRDEISELINEYEKNILVFLNEYLYTKNKGLKFTVTDNANIEHIMPASGKNIQVIRQDAEITDLDEFNTIVNKLGNKILLEEEINKSISNEWFKSKKQNSIKNKSGYKDSKYAIAKKLTSYPSNTWGIKDINSATKKAADRIIKFIFND